jgi:hypothetical protein
LESLIFDAIKWSRTNVLDKIQLVEAAFVPYRAAINRANSQHSTGPRAAAGKQRSSLNALRHGLTAALPVLPSEDPAVFEDHRRRFFDEYQPATPIDHFYGGLIPSAQWKRKRWLPFPTSTVNSGRTSDWADQNVMDARWPN